VVLGRFFVGSDCRAKGVDLLTKIGLVAFGSALGGLARWGVTVGTARVVGTAFPWGTLVINLIGSSFLGWLMTILSERLAANSWGWFQPADLRLMVAVGFTGAFTTFSTFEYEAHGLFRDGDSVAGLAYVIGSVVLGLIGVHLGIVLARSG
jgi:fluoride exporter